MIAVQTYQRFKNTVNPQVPGYAETLKKLQDLRNKQLALEKRMKQQRVLQELRRRGNARAAKYAEYIKQK